MPRKCKLQTCKAPINSFAKSETLHEKKGFCSFDHMVEWGSTQARKTIQRKEKKKVREARERLKTRSEWLREAQKEFNRYIRLRDKGKHCISCDKPDDGTHQRHASHYRSVGACSALRFNTFNVWASCAQCNSVKSGNLIEYRIRLRKLAGDDRVEWLESQNEPRRYSIDYLKRLRRVFKRRADILQKRLK